MLFSQTLSWTFYHVIWHIFINNDVAAQLACIFSCWLRATGQVCVCVCVCESECVDQNEGHKHRHVQSRQPATAHSMKHALQLNSHISKAAPSCWVVFVVENLTAVNQSENNILFLWHTALFTLILLPSWFIHWLSYPLQLSLLELGSCANFE